MLIEIEQGFRAIASFVALGVELAAVIVVAIGATQALVLSVRHAWVNQSEPVGHRGIWVRFASWILLSLEFALGADIIRTAIAPSWDDIGKLAAIAAIRTALNYFLGRDVKEAMELGAAEVEKG